MPQHDPSLDLPPVNPDQEETGEHLAAASMWEMLQEQNARHSREKGSPLPPIPAWFQSLYNDI